MFQVLVCFCVLLFYLPKALKIAYSRLQWSRKSLGACFRLLDVYFWWVYSPKHGRRAFPKNRTNNEPNYKRTELITTAGYQCMLQHTWSELQGSRPSFVLTSPARNSWSSSSEATARSTRRTSTNGLEEHLYYIVFRIVTLATIPTRLASRMLLSRPTKQIIREPMSSTPTKSDVFLHRSIQ